MLRLDTRTGSLASCHNRVAGWSCYSVPDERAALDAEIGKLQRENTQLKDNLARFKDEQARFDRDIAALKEAHLRLDAERMKLREELDKREVAAPAPRRRSTRRWRRKIRRRRARRAMPARATGSSCNCPTTRRSSVSSRSSSAPGGG